MRNQRPLIVGESENQVRNVFPYTWCAPTSTALRASAKRSSRYTENKKLSLRGLTLGQVVSRCEGEQQRKFRRDQRGRRRQTQRRVCCLLCPPSRRTPHYSPPSNHAPEKLRKWYYSKAIPKFSYCIHRTLTPADLHPAHIAMPIIYRIQNFLNP